MRKPPVSFTTTNVDAGTSGCIDPFGSTPTRSPIHLAPRRLLLDDLHTTCWVLHAAQSLTSKAGSRCRSRHLSESELTLKVSSRTLLLGLPCLVTVYMLALLFVPALLAGCAGPPRAIDRTWVASTAHDVHVCVFQRWTCDAPEASSRCLRGSNRCLWVCVRVRFAFSAS